MGHVPGAVNYYLEDVAFDEAIASFDKSKKCLVYGASNTAAEQGAQKLLAGGFQDVYWMKGGLTAWISAGYPIERGDMPKFQPVIQ